MDAKKMFIVRKAYRLKELREQGYTWSQLFIRTLQYFHIYSGKSQLIFQTYIEIKRIEKLHKKNNKMPLEVEAKNIAVIETGVLGDCMLVISAFQVLAAWCENHNIALDIICSKKMAKLFLENASITSANYICFSNRDQISYKEYKELAEKIGKKYYRYVLLRDSHSTAYRIGGLFRRQEAIYYSYDVDRNSRIDTWLVKKYFTEIKNIDDLYFIPQIWKLLLQRIGIIDYKTSVGHIKVCEKNHTLVKPYIVISPEASTTDRNLTEEQCIHVINFLQCNYPNYRLVLSSAANNNIYAKFLHTVAEKYELCDCVGNTSMSQYLALIAGASLVIGCDSGTIHLSAALNVQGICYTGYWDLPYFLPYEFDSMRENETYPIVLYSKIKPACAYCGTKNDVDICKEYIECQKRRDMNQSFFCLANIERKEVEVAIARCLSI